MYANENEVCCNDGYGIGFGFRYIAEVVVWFYDILALSSDLSEIYSAVQISDIAFFSGAKIFS